MIDLGLDGKRAVVSGAGWIPERAGHGRASTLRLAEAGATVACIDIDEGRAEAIVAEVEAAGGKAFPVIADMTDRPGRAGGRRGRGRLGGIDVCVDIIGRALWEKAEDFSDEDWAWTIENNLTQVFYLYRDGSSDDPPGDRRQLVALASVDGIAAAGFHSAYGAAKAGVISLIRTFADELGRHGIRVNAVAPGNVGSGNEDQPEGQYAVSAINPLAAPGSRDIANAVLFLSSDLAARITGQTLIVDGGATIRSLWGMTPDVIPHYRARY